jgi:hypothetical protein
MPCETKKEQINIPSSKGAITPPIATNNDGFPTFFNSERLISSPERNVKKRIPNCASKVNVSEV